jgi:hypothetical protein
MYLNVLYCMGDIIIVVVSRGSWIRYIDLVEQLMPIRNRFALECLVSVSLVLHMTTLWYIFSHRECFVILSCLVLSCLVVFCDISSLQFVCVRL